jgi:predicted ATPase
MGRKKTINTPEQAALAIELNKVRARERYRRIVKLAKEYKKITEADKARAIAESVEILEKAGK